MEEWKRISIMDSILSQIGRTKVLRETVYLYKHVLENYKSARKSAKATSNNNVLAGVPSAKRIILDTKQLWTTPTSIT